MQFNDLEEHSLYGQGVRCIQAPPLPGCDVGQTFTSLLGSISPICKMQTIVEAPHMVVARIKSGPSWNMLE